MEKILARDIMTETVISVGPEMSVRELIGVLTEHSINGCPVTDDEGRLIGVVSATDILAEERSRTPEVIPEDEYYTQMHLADAYLARDFQLVETNDATVADIMTPKIICVDEDLSLKGIASTMHSRNVHRVFVVRDGRLAGIVTTMDVLGAMKSM